MAAFVRFTYEDQGGDGQRTLYELVRHVGPKTYSLSKLPGILFYFLRYLDEDMNSVEMDEFEVLARVADKIPLTQGKEQWTEWVQLGRELLKSAPERPEAEFI
jgi:hypothetical protein